MIVRPIKTARVLPGQKTIFEILDESLPKLTERTVVVVTSKIIALCENRVVPIKSTDKEALVKRESDLYLPPSLSKYSFHFTIANKTLISLAGIDESNGGGNYVLWPSNPQKTANELREYLAGKFGLKELGVIISDSTCLPMRQGTLGIPLGYSGFLALNDYIGQPDLFGRPFKVSRGGVALGLAAAAVLTMGEGTEQTPIAVIKDVPFVKFQGRNPTDKELKSFYLESVDDDLFAPFLQSVPWQPGGRSTA